MSDLVIKDGTGKGYRAKVTEMNYLAVDAVQETAWHRNSEQDVGYILSAPQQAITATGGRFLWAQSSDLPLHINGFFVGWNGGSTNHNRMMEIQVYFNDTKPSVNTQVLTPRNPISNGGRAINIDSVSWNGTGNGMTTFTAGTLIDNYIVGPGFTFIPIDGSLLVAVNNSVSINLKGEEAGNATFVFSGYQEEV